MFTMNQSAVFHLHRIERSISSEAKRRFHLTNEDDIREILRLASASRNADIRKSLAIFIRNCETSNGRYSLLKSA